VFVVDGATEYETRCQHTAEKADEIERGCEQILRTFKVRGAEQSVFSGSSRLAPAPRRSIR
jgi:hypothetical protein